MNMRDLHQKIVMKWVIVVQLVFSKILSDSETCEETENNVLDGRSHTWLVEF